MWWKPLRSDRLLAIGHGGLRWTCEAVKTVARVGRHPMVSVGTNLVETYAVGRHYEQPIRDQLTILFIPWLRSAIKGK
jgi:hypothetical protein